jgi:hypothetical protein
MSLLSDWKLKLRYGRLTTPYKHMTLLVDGILDNEEGRSRAIMAGKVWDKTSELAMDLIADLAPRLGFDPDGRWYVYDTDPEQPPGDSPSVYGVNFTRYEGDEPADMDD